MNYQFQIGGFHFRYNVVLRIKVTRYIGYISRKYLTPATSRLSQSPAGELLSPGGVLFIRYRDTGIQPSNRGASRSTLSDRLRGERGGEKEWQRQIERRRGVRDDFRRRQYQSKRQLLAVRERERERERGGGGKRERNSYKCCIISCNDTFIVRLAFHSYR
ncbi:hypothetical protein ALC53_06766 [Atta colombica]|uniref:Uncharacterized protein n=1 Tax=Atta colombica TaxID=520822 RepID=A0A151I3D7_9HYME|nr:hypothetical protein ALC53_06766 [Atta colombica]